MSNMTKEERIRGDIEHILYMLNSRYQHYNQEYLKTDEKDTNQRSFLAGQCREVGSCFKLISHITGVCIFVDNDRVAANEIPEAKEIMEAE